LCIIAVDFDATGQVLIIYSAFIKYLIKKLEYNEAVHQLLVDFKKAYDQIKMEVLYITAIEFDVTMNLVRRLKMCVNETYSSVWEDKHLYDVLPIDMV